MPFRIEYESSFTHDLTGRRLPKTETRATMDSAEKRARDVLRRMTSAEPTRTVLGGAGGMVYLNYGPHYGASICAD